MNLRPSWRFVTGFGAAVLTGALSAIGRPGLDVLPVAIAGTLLLCVVAVRSAWPVTVLYSAGFGIGLFGMISWGALTWGWVVPAALTLIGTVLFAVPLACWARFGAWRLRPARFALATASGWALWMDVGDRLGYPLKIVSASLLVHVPEAFAGARLVGFNVVEGLMVAALACTAQPIARQSGPWGAKAAGRALAAPAVVGALLGALAVAAYASAPRPAGQRSVGVPQLDMSSTYYASRITEPSVAVDFSHRLQEVLAKLGDVDLLVTPETFDGRYDLIVPSLRQAWQDYAASHHQAILLASDLVEENGWTSNAVGGIDARGEWIGVSRKVNLALYGERHLAAGTSREPMPIFPGFSVGTMICQEAVLPWASRELSRAGAALLSVSTNDSSFGSSITVFEHLAAAQQRAIEVGRDVIWASNAGPSALVDRWGRVHDATPMGDPAAARFAASLYQDLTPFDRAPNAWSILCALVFLGSMCGARPYRAGARAGSEARDSNGKHAARAALQAALLALAGGLLLISPALVEAAHGDSSRAERSIRAVFASPTVLGSADPFARFRTAPSDSARGAIGYYLSFFGAEVPPSDQREQGERSLDDVLGAVSSYLPSRFVALDERNLPRVATIVQARGGELMVLTRPTGDGAALLFSPVAGRPIAVPPSRLQAALLPKGIIPLGVACDPTGCGAERP